MFDGLPLGSLPNNDFVRLDPSSPTLCLVCRSDSTMENVGMLIGPNENIVDDFDITRPQAGQLSVSSTSTSIPANEEGVYTCRIPDSTGTMRDVNFGIYNNILTSELY